MKPICDKSKAFQLVFSNASFKKIISISTIILFADTRKSHTKSVLYFKINTFSILLKSLNVLRQFNFKNTLFNGRWSLKRLLKSLNLMRFITVCFTRNSMPLNAKMHYSTIYFNTSFRYFSANRRMYLRFHFCIYMNSKLRYFNWSKFVSFSPHL